MLIFSPNAGRVSRVSPTAISQNAVLTFPDFNFLTLQSILTATTLQLRSSYQVSNTIGGNILMIAFGESPGPVAMSGVIFEDVCEEAGVDDIAKHGVQQMLEWWETKNVYDEDTPLQIFIGDQYTVDMFMTDMNIQIDDPVNRIWSFSMSLIRIPGYKDLLDGRYDQVPSPTQTAGLLTAPSTTPATVTPLSNGQPSSIPFSPRSSPPVDGSTSWQDATDGGRGFDPVSRSLEGPISER